MFNFNKREYLIIMFTIVLVLGFLGVKAFSNRQIQPQEQLSTSDNIIIESENKTTDKEKDEVEEDIYVHISGQVKSPGLLVVKSGNRLADVIEKAGGVLPQADLDKVNLAKKVVDEEKIYIPAQGEEVQMTSTLPSATTSGNKIVNINTASMEELKTLPGVGEKTADKIIKFRESQRFEIVEDLMEVPGIGEKKFQELKNYIGVN